MRQFETLEEAYDYCLAEGEIITISEVDKGQIKSNLRIAEEDLQSGKDSIAKKRWNSAYKNYYDVLHQLVESFLKFDNIKSRNHLCLYCYLCFKHPELELDWDFFEKVRTKRNGIHYYGSPVAEKDWKEVSLQFQLYIDLLKRKIEERL
jgi:uncharacterized protein (UPF0332 family)